MISSSPMLAEWTGQRCEDRARMCRELRKKAEERWGAAEVHGGRADGWMKTTFMRESRKERYGLRPRKDSTEDNENHQMQQSV